MFAPDDGWRHHPKHVEQFSDINKPCNVASCWIYNILEYALSCIKIDLHVTVFSVTIISVHLLVHYISVNISECRDMEHAK